MSELTQACAHIVVQLTVQTRLHIHHQMLWTMLAPQREQLMLKARVHSMDPWNLESNGHTRGVVEKEKRIQLPQLRSANAQPNAPVGPSSARVSELTHSRHLRPQFRTRMQYPINFRPPAGSSKRKTRTNLGHS